MAQLLLLRHAQSTWNAKKLWQGRADPPASEAGRRAAAAKAKDFAEVDAIYCSPLLRAAQTAEIIAQELDADPPIAYDDLVERDLGEWSGLTREEVDAGWPGYLDQQKWPPSAEPTDVLRERALGCLAKIAEEWAGVSRNGSGTGGAGTGGADPNGAPENEAKLLVVTHGGLITQVEQTLGLDWRRISNLGGRVLLYGPSNSATDHASATSSTDQFQLGEVIEAPAAAE